MRHATAAYHALSQGVASKRRTKSFDMAALPSVPEMNASAIPSRTSQEVRATLRSSFLQCSDVHMSEVSRCELKCCFDNRQQTCGRRCRAEIACKTQSLAALTGGADSWGSNHASTAELAALASQAAVAALQASAPGDQQPLRALSSSSGEVAQGHIDQLVRHLWMCPHSSICTTVCCLKLCMDSGSLAIAEVQHSL